MWYIVLSENKDDQKIHYEEHRRWLEDQNKAGGMLFSGPTTHGAYGNSISCSQQSG